jgi:hypothetical protein
VFEKRVLRRVLGPKREEVSGEWRKLHNEKLRNMHFLLDIIVYVVNKGEKGCA